MTKAPTQDRRLTVLLNNHEAERLALLNRTKAALIDGERNRAGTTPDAVAAGKDNKGIENFLRAMPGGAWQAPYLPH